ncbi:molybdenum cofactor guanylyltransferase [Caldifermentibacillus hisashii]|uniref:molybdenum cofactor guanylyltransferase n=1 Tax=Bacillaceae TaxID=186817 RepID=UPI00203ED780|nr:MULTISPECIES: molybdenum cofactor guanylyltransferase [Bacillaceae]MCM3477892.1 molybdenum cofactor guanylyltransferase [Caldibacillus thermoamylovorans]MED4853326.1 molybdenum cofactor guanylyltransferase [Caldifermentibacillus hisashii]
MNDIYQGVVLAGGESRRFGSPKAFAEIDGIPFYQCSINAIQPFCPSIVIVTKPNLQEKFKRDRHNVAVINDVKEFRGQGPLAGLYSAMEYRGSPWYMVTPIDVPFVEASIFGQLIKFIDKNIDGIVPIVSGKKQPLIAIYNYSIKDEIRHMLENGERSVQQLLGKFNIRYIPMNIEQSFININRKTDFFQYIQPEVSIFGEELM